MKEQIIENEVKDGYQEEGQYYLFAMMIKEAGKIGYALGRGMTTTALRRACVNVANYAMLIVGKN